ncbi:guanyl-nucleotide exchange factor [Lithospermum erythrorhizon]|uniref:Guanyl-nucleotide exchange factor n=1 Tax=Lithospermum erythrorhizon TaxID=34254 RepID=A0AAV3NWV4_LITER
MDGQLGADEENSLIPRIVNGFSELRSDNTLTVESETESKKPLKVSSIKAGGMMSLAIDDIGGLWIWGNCPHPELSKSEEGEFSFVSSSVPIPVWNFHGHTVVKVACGNEHVVALVSAGETHAGGDLLCYSWGGNNHGQLGLGDKESRKSPELIEMFNLESPLEVYEVSCGAFHTALLTHRKRPSDTLKSLCWTFGLGDNGQLGHGITKSYLSPEPVSGLPDSIFLISVACGLFHTCTVSSAGDVWSWGMEKGLGLCPDASFNRADSGDAVSPLNIPCTGVYGPRFPEPVLVACGAAHTVLLADAGYKLWSWGRGRSGVLGNGKQVDCFTPTIAMWPPLIEDFKENEPDSSGGDEKTDQKSSKEIQEMEKRLSIATEEMKLLRSKYSVMERYASILHGSIFGRPFQEQDIPASLQSSGTFDIAKEWENMLDSSDRAKLHKLEMFYMTMTAGIKDKLMKKRIQEIVKECLHSETINK